MDLLTAQLDEYNKYGVPKPPNVYGHHDMALDEEGSTFLLFLFRVLHNTRNLYWKFSTYFRLLLARSFGDYCDTVFSSLQFGA